MMFLVALTCLLVTVTAQTVMPTPHQHGNGTGHHHESPEREFWSFTFEPASGYMVVLKEQECYLWRITPSEKSMIHTDDGLRSVEIRVVGEIENAIYTVIDKDILSRGIQNSCGKNASKFLLVH